MSEMVFLAVGLGVSMLVMAWILVNFYRKCPPNAAMIISGMSAAPGGGLRIVVGGGAIVLPLIQQVNIISLETLKVDVKPAAPMTSSDNIPLFVSGTAQVKVKGDDVSIATAAELLLGKSSEEVVAIAQQTIIASLRVVVASMTASDVVKHPEDVINKVAELTVAELAKMGLTIVSFSIAEVRDEVGYLDLLAREQVERKRQEVQG